jgi:antitoxin ParD1/3/4
VGWQDTVIFRSFRSCAASDGKPPDTCQPCHNGFRTNVPEGSAMPTRNINLTPRLDRFVATKIKSGRYENASEVVRAGLRTLKSQEKKRDEQEHAAKLSALRQAIDEGDASGVAAGNVFGRVRKTLKLSASR